MSFIQFESAREKEKIREELRSAREELLKRAQKQSEYRAEKEVQKKLSGASDWIHPAVSKKIDEMSSKISKRKESKKSSKSKKKKSKSKHGNKSKKKKKRSRSSSSNCSSDSDSSSEEEKIKKKSRKRKYSTPSDSSSSESEEKQSGDNWVEKSAPLQRDDWMTSGLLLKTYSKSSDKKNTNEKQNIDAYDPSKSARELNPHWKDGGGGLPTFRKPKEDDDDNRKTSRNVRNSYGSGSWRKTTSSSTNTTSPGTAKQSSSRHRNPSPRRDKPTSSSHRRSITPSNSSESEVEEVPEPSSANPISTSDFLTDQQMNELGAKMLKAEIMGDNDLCEALREKLEKARKIREETKQNARKPKAEQRTRSKSEDEHILLTTTDSKGMSRPLPNRPAQQSDLYGGRAGKKSKHRKVETHESGERVRFFPDDDRYDIKQMFEREKYTSAADSDAQFADIAGKHKNPNDDMEDIFADKVRKGLSGYEQSEKDEKRAIREHERLNKMLDNCDKCFDSPKMEKQLLVSMGESVYLSLPWHEGLQTGHCLIVPIQHVACSTNLDEDTWSEITAFRKALTRMFTAKKQDVVFFETVKYLHKKPHMAIHCVPIGDCEMAPFYFKKAIQESEYEWSTNKQLVSLKDKDLLRSIPKGLPYFWVNFGMDSGFAHVIEDQEKFPSNFAQEIIGGMLHLDPKRWRKPRKEQSAIQKVKQLADWWKDFDCTKS